MFKLFHIEQKFVESVLNVKSNMETDEFYLELYSIGNDSPFHSMEKYSLKNSLDEMQYSTSFCLIIFIFNVIKLQRTNGPNASVHFHYLHIGWLVGSIGMATFTMLLI